MTAPLAASEVPPSLAVLTAVADDVVDKEMRTWKVPGAVVAVVELGHPPFVKGYGLADLTSQRPVDGRTVFHVAALAKPLTAVGVLQLVADGRLALDADVGSHLPRLDLESEFSGPITPFHLLTHTAGLDERTIGRKAPAPLATPPLREFVHQRLPPRVRPAGVVSVYSSHGYALAGLLVEEISEWPFAAYMEAFVFAPLAMRESSYGVTPTTEGQLATGYGWSGREGPVVPMDFIKTGPASMLLTSGEDMARFMTALLEAAAGGDSPLLPPRLASQMLSRQFTNHPATPGRSLGFSEGTRFAPAEFLHSGGASGFSSGIVLIPSRSAGIFVAFNSQAFVWDLISGLLDYFDFVRPARSPGEAAEPTAVDVGDFAGHYRDASLPLATFEHIVSLIEQNRLEAREGGEVFWRGRLYSAVGPELFKSADDATLAFSQGGAKPRFLSAAGSVFERVAWYEERPLQAGVWALVVLIMSLGATGWAGRHIPRRRAGLAETGVHGPLWPFAVVRLACILNLLFVTAFAVVLSQALGGKVGLEYGVPSLLWAIMSIPLASTPLAAVVVLWATWSWPGALWDRRARVRLSVLGTTLAVFVGLLAMWNLLGFRF